MIQDFKIRAVAIAHVFLNESKYLIRSLKEQAPQVVLALDD
jgi:hypothetical protein